MSQNPESGGAEGDEIKPELDIWDIGVHFCGVPHSGASHYFIDTNPSDPAATVKVTGFEHWTEATTCITQFLTLSIVTGHVIHKHQHPIVDFQQSNSFGFQVIHGSSRAIKGSPNESSKSQRTSGGGERREEGKTTKAHALKASARKEVQRMKTKRTLELAEACILKEAERARRAMEHAYNLTKK